MGPEVNCPRYASPNSKFVRPLNFDENVNAIWGNQEYIKKEFGIETPAIIYPFGHNSTQNTKILKLLGISYGFNTDMQSVCRDQLLNNYKNNFSNYDI